MYDKKQKVYNFRINWFKGKLSGQNIFVQSFGLCKVTAESDTPTVAS